MDPKKSARNIKICGFSGRVKQSVPWKILLTGLKQQQKNIKTWCSFCGRERKRAQQVVFFNCTSRLPTQVVSNRPYFIFVNFTPLFMPVKVHQIVTKYPKKAKIGQNLRLPTQVVSSSLLKRFFNKENMVKMMSNSYFCLSTNVVY